jgi:hypothetical protein
MSTETLWWITLGVGLVVALVVWGLLHMLYRNVKAIDEGLEAVWASGKAVARNTATSWMLGQTVRVAGEIKEEASKHDAMFSRGES